MRKVFFLAIAVCMTIATHAQEKRYGIESGILKTKTSMMGQHVLITQYFTDYGAKESVETTMKFQEQELVTFSMIKDGYAYVANLTMKQGSKIKLTGDMDDYRNINFLSLTDEMKNKYRLEEKGVEQILGKECKKYVLNYALQGQNIDATIWVWKGLTLKVETSIATIEATEIIETNDIPGSRFELPEGINFTEMNPNMFNLQ
jgi:hypothetical protein